MCTNKLIGLVSLAGYGSRNVVGMPIPSLAAVEFASLKVDREDERLGVRHARGASVEPSILDCCALHIEHFSERLVDPLKTQSDFTGFCSGERLMSQQSVSSQYLAIILPAFLCFSSRAWPKLRNPRDLGSIYKLFQECDLRLGLDITTLLPQFSHPFCPYGEKPCCMGHMALLFRCVPTIG